MIEFLEHRTLFDQTPYLGKPAAIPGTIQAEYFDAGGEGVAYHDTDGDIYGNPIRVGSRVDTQANPPKQGGYSVGHVKPGEWLEFTVNVVSGGTYSAETRAAAPNGGLLEISFDGYNESGRIGVFNTGGWTTFQTYTTEGLWLSAGVHVMRVSFISTNRSGEDIGNFDYFRFVQTSTTGGNGFAVNPLSWQSKASASPGREEAQSLVYNDRLYVLGGYVAGFTATRRVDRYDLATNSWTRMNDMPDPITHAAVARDGNNFWFVGGFLGSFGSGTQPPGIDTVYIYHANTDTWSQGPSLPVEHGAGGAAIVGRNLYFFSGADRTRTFDRAESYVLNLDDPNAGWRRIPDLPVARNHLGGVSVNGQVYAIGGQLGLEDEGVSIRDCHRYDPNNETWHPIAPLPRALSHFTASTVIFDRYIITVGGENPHNVAQAFVFAYDTVRDKWSRLTDLPGPRRAGVAGIIGTKLVQSTGYDRPLGHTGTTYVADLINTFI